MENRKLVKCLALFLAILTVFGSTSFVFADNENADAVIDEADADVVETYTQHIDANNSLIGNMSYTDYRERYSDVTTSGDNIVIDAADYDAEKTDAAVEILTDYEGMAGDSLLTPASGKTSWTFEVETEGWYALDVTYYPYPGTKTTIERSMFIDGKIPFSETRYLYFPRCWEYEYTEEEGVFSKDINGNDTRPRRQEAPQWTTYFVRDWLGYTLEPFQFYLTAGTHTITLQANREPMLLKTFEFYEYKPGISYEDYINAHTAAGAKNVAAGTEPIVVQAENPSLISIQNLFPANDRTSALTQPQDPTVIKYNMLDCGTVGQWMRYEVEVEESGFYTIAARYRQNSLNGLFTSRRIRINGEIPFEEASYLRFPYNTAWQCDALNDGEHDFLFYLEKGTNVIELEVVLGDMTDYVYQVQQIIEELNADYQKILQITGPSPDAYRDYGFSTILPETIINIAQNADRLYEIAAELKAVTGETGDQVQTLETIALLLETMSTNEYEIAPNFITFKNYIISLSNWLYAALAQPLKLDYLSVQSPEDDLPKGAAGFFQAAWFETKAFIGSFFMDYTTIGFSNESKDVVNAETDTEEETVVMWAISDRENSLILRYIIDNYFTPESNINVTIKIVTAGLTEAILAGIGPDVSFMTATDTVTWGLRTAVEPLNDFEGFDEIIAEFSEAATTPLTLYGTTYGLPNTMTFDMMFVRTDVMEELNLELPETWDDLYDIMPALQNRYLEIGIPSSFIGTVGTVTVSKNTLNVLSSMIYQADSTLYADDGKLVNLDSNEALSAFEQLTGLFKNYDNKISWEISRFRTGELPIVIADAITTYNQLMTFYELRGLWKMLPILGTEKADGTIDITSTVTPQAIVIPRGAANPEASWQFAKWYVSADTQAKLANEQVAIATPTTKYATANTEAMLGQPWTDEEYAAISKQMEYLVGNPEYPGQYIVNTYVNNAFADVYNNSTDPVDAMLDRILDMNKEITRKRGEFDMEQSETYYSSNSVTAKGNMSQDN